MNTRLKKSTVQFRDETFSIREITYGERKAFLARHAQDAVSASSLLVAACTLKEDGTKYFDDESILENEPPGLVDTLCSAILELSGVGKDEKSPEDPVKNV